MSHGVMAAQEALTLLVWVRILVGLQNNLSLLFQLLKRYSFSVRGLEYKKKLSSFCPIGGIGRHAALRMLFLRECRFKSYMGYTNLIAMEEKEKQYRVQSSPTISGLVNFMNKIHLQKDEFITIQPIEGEYLMIYYK